MHIYGLATDAITKMKYGFVARRIKMTEFHRQISEVYGENTMSTNIHDEERCGSSSLMQEFHFKIFYDFVIIS